MTGPAKSLGALCGQRRWWSAVPSAGPQLHLVSQSPAARERATRQDPTGMPHGNTSACEAGIERCCFFGKRFLVNVVQLQAFFRQFCKG